MCSAVRAIIGMVFRSMQVRSGQRPGRKDDVSKAKTGKQTATPTTQGEPLPGTIVSPGVYHRELLERLMPDTMVDPIIEFGRRNPVIPTRPQNPQSADSTDQPSGDAAKKR